MGSDDPGSYEAFVARVVRVVREGLDRAPTSARPRIAAIRRLDVSKLNGLHALLVRPDGVSDDAWASVIRGLELTVYDDLGVDIWVAECSTLDLRSFACALAIRETLTTNLPIYGDLDKLRASMWRPTAAYTAGRVRAELGRGSRSEAVDLIDRFDLDLSDAPVAALLRLTATPPPTTGDSDLDARIVEAVRRAVTSAGLTLPGWLAGRRP